MIDWKFVLLALICVFYVTLSTNSSIVYHTGLIKQLVPVLKSDIWGCDSTILIQEQYGDQANSILKTPMPAGGRFDNMTCVTKIVSPIHTRILFAVQSLKIARMDRKKEKACRHGAVIVFFDPPNIESRSLFCQEIPEPIISKKNKLVVIYKLFRFAINPMEFEAYFTVIYVAKLNTRVIFNVSPLLESHGTITELPSLHLINSSQRRNLKLKKFVNCTLHIVPPCNGDVLKVGYEYPLETGSMLFINITCDESVGTPYIERSLIQKRVPSHQLMYIDLEVNSNTSDKFSVTWECTRESTQSSHQKKIKLIAGLPSQTVTTFGEPDPGAGKTIRPLVLTARYKEVRQLEDEYL